MMFLLRHAERLRCSVGPGYSQDKDIENLCNKKLKFFVRHGIATSEIAQNQVDGVKEVVHPPE